VTIVYPVHLNPNVWGPVHETIGKIANVHLLPPLDYAPFVSLMQRSFFILTDSGGIQEEAPALNKPVLVMREETERSEAVGTGAARLVGTEPKTIVSEAERLLTNSRCHSDMVRAANPYGEGTAAQSIVRILRQFGEQKSWGT
jgi:UDP-N-acetylglucosamine 2-epimerase (non-hydrolysing)